MHSLIFFGKREMSPKALEVLPIHLGVPFSLRFIEFYQSVRWIFLLINPVLSYLEWTVAICFVLGTFHSLSKKIEAHAHAHTHTHILCFSRLLFKNLKQKYRYWLGSRAGAVGFVCGKYEADVVRVLAALCIFCNRKCLRSSSLWTNSSVKNLWRQRWIWALFSNIFQFCWWFLLENKFFLLEWFT